jgi:hypothetical protein
MTLLSHLGHPTVRVPLPQLRRPARSGGQRPRALVQPQEDGEQPLVDRRVYAVQRIGAVGVALFLLAFGLLGAAGGAGFLTTHGERYLGLSSDGLLSALSIAVALVLLGAALRGPRIASTVMIVLGALFLISALVNLALLRSAFNVLAFRMSNVVFSEFVGLLLLMLGAYGRISGNLPTTSPYAHPHALLVEPPDLPSSPEEVAAEAAMAEAEVAVVQLYATPDQRRRVQAMSGVRTRDGRRRVWMEYDRYAPTAGSVSRR